MMKTTMKHFWDTIDKSLIRVTLVSQINDAIKWECMFIPITWFDHQATDGKGVVRRNPLKWGFISRLLKSIVSLVRNGLYSFHDQLSCWEEYIRKQYKQWIFVKKIFPQWNVWMQFIEGRTSAPVLAQFVLESNLKFHSLFFSSISIWFPPGDKCWTCNGPRGTRQIVDFI